MLQSCHMGQKRAKVVKLFFSDYLKVSIIYNYQQVLKCIRMYQSVFGIILPNKPISGIPGECRNVTSGVTDDAMHDTHKPPLSGSAKSQYAIV